MCGLVATVGNLFMPDVRVFNEMLFADYLRGSHATGVAAVRGKRAEVFKRAYDPLELMRQKGYDNIVTPTADALIGHNRHGTIGNNASHANAHPFDFKNVVGAHNGTLERACVRGLHNSAYYDTDSEALYSEISEHGIDEAFTKIAGAWALVFVDKNEGTFNLIRNDQRPLYYAYKKGRTVMYVASEWGMLDWIVSRNKIELEGNDGYELPVNTLHTWKLGHVLGEPVVRDLKASFVPPWQREDYVYDNEIKDWRKGSPEEIKEKKERATRTYFSTSGGTSAQGPFRGQTQQTATQTTQAATQGRTTASETSHVALLTDHRGSTTQTGKNTTEHDTEVLESSIFSARRFRREQIEKYGPGTYRGRDGNILGRMRVENIIQHNCCAYCGNDDVKYGDPIMFLDTTNGRGWQDFLCEDCLTVPEIVDLTGTD